MMIRTLVIALACASAAACSSPSRPSPTPGAAGGSSMILTSSGAGAASDRAIFGAAAVDLARCLHGAADSVCFSASRLGDRLVTAKALAPGAPGNLVASSSGSTVTLTWTAPSSGDAVSSYVIEAGSSSGLANLANFATGNTSTTFSASGIGNGTYFIRVRAQNSAGMSAASNEATLIVGAVGCAGPPGAPTGLAGSASGGTVTLSWSAPAGGCPVSSYVLEAGSASGLSNLANAGTGGTSTTFVATGVGAGTYYIRVRAQNASGTSGTSNEVIVTVGGTTPSTGALVATATPNPVPFSGQATTVCSGTNTWFYAMTLRDTTGVGLIVTHRYNVIDGQPVNDFASNFSIPANGTVNTTFTWCATSATSSHTVQTTWTGTDARGNAFSVLSPDVILLASGVTGTTPSQHFQATWVNASWLGNTGRPLNSKGIEAPTHFGQLCPPSSLILEFRPSYDPFDEYLYAYNTSCTPTMVNVAFCRTSGSGGGGSNLPTCSIDPRKTPANNLYIHPRIPSTHSPIGSGPVNFDINAFWCSDTSTFNLGKYPGLDNLECVPK